MLLKLWAFRFLFIIIIISQTSALDFGVCEKSVLRRMLNTSVTPPEHYKVNVTIRECCFGFLTLGKSCVPVCQNVCINSHCIGNNTCKCNSGYKKVDNFRCLPICEPSCGRNMACLAPNKCLCKPEYKKVNESYCEPTCLFTTDNFDCINAKCVAPNVCECMEGFKMVSEFQCEPICANCENGDCVSPEVCDCHTGYEKNANGICEPSCNPSCLNGKCVAPNTCECDDSFEKYLKSHECLEKHVIKDRQSCEKSCQHGTCNDDGTCICQSGYEMYNGKCLKVCAKECVNGKCLEDQCVCPFNYKLSENSSGCVPICAFEDGHDCISGTCVAPNVCECYDGYRFLDDRNCTCVPKCIPQCINAICTDKGCICHENFYNISDHECIKNCSEGFKWVYDDCIEESFFELFETDDSEGIDVSTTELVTSYKETTESDESYDNVDSFESPSASTVKSINLNEIIVKKSILPQLTPAATLITIISIILFLISLILIMFCILYQRINHKNIYYVNDRENSSNGVYFSKYRDPSEMPEFESSL